jgi:hypothetical protein
MQTQQHENENEETLIVKHECWRQLINEMINEHKVSPDDASQSMLTVAITSATEVSGHRDVARQLRVIADMLDRVAATTQPMQ